MDIDSQLLSYDQLNKIYREQKKNTPYAVSLSKQSQNLLIIGVNHTYDSTNPQIPFIIKEWNEFISGTSSEDIISLSEGGVRPTKGSIEEAVASYGEAGLIAYLAHEEDIVVISPEPSPSVEADELLKRFSKEQIIYYYFARRVAQWNRMSAKPDLRKESERVLNYYNKDLKWSYDYESMLRIHEKITGVQFNPSDAEFFNKICSPMTTGTIINKVSRASSRYRDLYIAERISDLWSEGKSLFGVYGSAHVFVLEPFISSL